MWSIARVVVRKSVSLDVCKEIKLSGFNFVWMSCVVGGDSCCPATYVIVARMLFMFGLCFSNDF